MKFKVIHLGTVYLLFLILRLRAATLYVDLNSADPTPPYSNWSTAANNIQVAIDASHDGDQILVTNGFYQTGGETVNGYALTNRVVINKAVTVQSINGPNVTEIAGYQMPEVTNGESAVRCVYMTNGATLIGFTLTNGATLTATNYSPDLHEEYGGGIWCESTNILILNCVMAGNAAMWAGGGVVNGMLSNCTFTANSAGTYDGFGGGAYNSILNNCLLANNWAYYGGGASGGTLNDCILTNNSAEAGGGVAGNGIYVNGTTLNNCILSGNTAISYGGASDGCILNNCILVGNSTDGNGGGADSGTLNNCILMNNAAPNKFGYGGGAFQATLNNCTLVGNWAGQYGGGSYYGTLNSCLLYSNYVVSGFGGGSYYGTLNNCTVTGNNAGVGGGTYFTTLNSCIVYFNTSPQSPNNRNNGNLMNYCCTIPLPVGGSGNITNDPNFVDFIGGNFRLQSNSPCINSGDGSSGTGTDLDGNPRVVGGAVDMGAYEFQNPGFTLPYIWAQQYGLPTDGSIDSDGDGMNNWQEWIAGTNPTNAASLLRILSVSNSISGPTVTWQSVSGKLYFLQRSTNLSALPAFSTIDSYIFVFGQTGVTSYRDIGAVGAGPFFYRVGVQ